MQRTLWLVIALLGLGMWPGPAALAQEATPTLQRSQGESLESQLLRLSDILGRLHYVRGLCEPADGSFWRDRMMELIRLEKPPIGQRNKMVGQFNAGYAEASGRFSSCTDNARSYAVGAAREGETLAQRLGEAIDPVDQDPG